LGGGNDHLGEQRLMAVNDDVDVIGLHDAKIGLGLQRSGCAEQLGVHEKRPVRSVVSMAAR